MFTPVCYKLSTIVNTEETPLFDRDNLHQVGLAAAAATPLKSKQYPRREMHPQQSPRWLRVLPEVVIGTSRGAVLSRLGDLVHRVWYAPEHLPSWNSLEGQWLWISGNSGIR